MENYLPISAHWLPFTNVFHAIIRMGLPSKGWQTASTFSGWILINGSTLTDNAEDLLQHTIKRYSFKVFCDLFEYRRNWLICRLHYRENYLGQSCDSSLRMLPCLFLLADMAEPSFDTTKKNCRLRTQCEPSIARPWFS